MLGIIMGIASVVILQTIGEWTQNQILKRLSSFGTNNITVSTARASNDIRTDNIVDNKVLINDDMIRLLKNIKNVQYVVPTQSTNTTISYQELSVNANINGVDIDYIKANTLVLYNGSMFQEQDYQTATYKALIWAELAQTLFGKADPLGQAVRVGNNYITIIWILSTQWSNPLSNPDNSLFVTLATMKDAISQQANYQSLAVVADKTEHVESVKASVESILQTAYLSKWWASMFSISSNTSFLESSQQIILFLQLFLGAVAGISLLIWWIGIMNIMLVSVSERTREIGIRKAVGATYTDILLQFLCESSGLTLVSGGIGIFLSYIAILAFNKAWFMEDPMSLSSFGLTIGVSFSIAVGMIFGLLPARKAAMMKLVDALRFE